MESRSWDWEKEKNSIWLEPSMESYYFAERWKNASYTHLLDYGCGLGRHSILFAKKGFSVSAFDLSQYGIDFLTKWAEQENLDIKTEVADTAKLPYLDNSFDCIFAYHVISHTTTEGFINALAELKRILKPSGEFFITLCSKETWSFTQAKYPKIDENSVLKTDDGAEKNVPHFYVNMDDIWKYFSDCTLIDIKHTDHCFFQNKKTSAFCFAASKGDAADWCRWSDSYSASDAAKGGTLFSGRPRGTEAASKNDDAKIKKRTKCVLFCGE